MKYSTKVRSGNLSREKFERLNDTNKLPNESTLETNITHKQLVDFETSGRKTVALSPTRFEEGNITSGGGPLGKGYDITFDTAHEIVFQHKAPKKAVVRGEDNRNKRLWLRYNIDFAQILNLAVQYDPRQAYLALPAVPQQGLLDTSLEATIFVDVWTLYSRVKEDGLLPDYILVEYLPGWIDGMRPDYDSDGKLSRDEYFRNQPIIKCKHKCGKWGMKYNKPDPYIEIPLGYQAVQWKPIREEFRNSVGLEITNPLRFDGGNHSPEDWPPIDLSEEYSDEYREHLKRKYALNQLGEQYDEPESESIIQWILDDLENRYSRAIEMEMFAPLSQEVDRKGLVEDVYEYKTSTREILSRFMEKRNPELYKLTNASRCVVQSGGRRDANLQFQ